MEAETCLIRSAEMKGQWGRQLPGNDYRLIEQLPDNHQGRYAYRNGEGKLLWVIQRYSIDGKKQFGIYMPLLKEGKIRGWATGSGLPIPKKDRPLYGLVDLLKATQHAK